MDKHENTVMGDRRIEFDTQRRVMFKDRNNVSGSFFYAKDLQWNAFPLSFSLNVGHVYIWLQRPVKITFDTPCE